MYHSPLKEMFFCNKQTEGVSSVLAGKDYQGNNVAVMDGKQNVLQETNYYPYGEPWREPEGEPEI